MFRYSLAAVILVLGTLEAAAAPGQVEISPETCRQLQRHQPAPDVAFQPGVDVNGQKVAPADLPGERLNLSDPIMVEIEVDLFRRFGIPVEGRSNFTGRAIIGTVEIGADGGVYFNRKPLPGELQREIAIACAVKSPR